MLSPVPLTDIAGSTAAIHLPEGAYEVSLSGQPQVPAQTVLVREGGETAVTLQLP